MTRARPMSAAERAALADALRDMRRAGLRPRELIHTTGAKPRAVYESSRTPRSIVRVRP